MANPTRRPTPFRHTYSQSGIARPIDPAGTTETGFVGVLTISGAVLHTDASGASLRIESPDCAEPAALVTTDAMATGLGRPGVYPVNPARLHTALLRQMRPLRSIDEIDEWREELARELAVECMCAAMPGLEKVAQRAEDLWDGLSRRERRDWLSWLRGHTGWQRLELALRGFFDNGGRIAHVVISLHGPDGGVVPRDLLVDAFDSKPALAMVCAPGLDDDWQRALLEYAGPQGRGDLFAILDGPPSWPAPRPESGAARGPYAVAPLPARARPEPARIVHADDIDTWGITDRGGFGAAFGPWVYVDNVTSQLPAERYALVPPSGHVAGAIAASDLAPEGGVHRALTLVGLTGIADTGTVFAEEEIQRLLRTRLNPLLAQPRHGLRIAADRTLATDTSWTAITSRRCWLFVARSLRAGLQWAVQSTSPDRLDEMEATIHSFLQQQYEKGVITGDAPEDAWLVDRSEPDELSVWVRPASHADRVQVVVYAIR